MWLVEVPHCKPHLVTEQHSVPSLECSRSHSCCGWWGWRCRWAGYELQHASKCGGSFKEEMQPLLFKTSQTLSQMVIKKIKQMHIYLLHILTFYVASASLDVPATASMLLWCLLCCFCFQNKALQGKWIASSPIKQEQCREWERILPETKVSWKDLEVKDL